MAAHSSALLVVRCATLTALGRPGWLVALGSAAPLLYAAAGVAGCLPQAAMGLLMDKELQYLEGELENPARRVVGIGSALGVDSFGQSGSRPELYHEYGIDADHIVNAALLGLELKGD